MHLLAGLTPSVTACLVGTTTRLATRVLATEQYFPWRAKRLPRPGGEGGCGVANCGCGTKHPFNPTMPRTISALIALIPTTVTRTYGALYRVAGSLANYIAFLLRLLRRLCFGDGGSR
jgi:hypothetical protein